jgi:hypothetical protein
VVKLRLKIGNDADELCIQRDDGCYSLRIPLKMTPGSSKPS